MENGKTKLTFYGGAESVTGVNILLETFGEKPTRILLDCGLFQGEKIFEAKNNEKFPYDPASIDALFVSHAHIDHTGRIPRLVRDGFKGKIYSTPPTKEIADALLRDSIGILGKQAHAQKFPPLYILDDVDTCMRNWESVPYYESVKIGGCIVTFHNAGHVLGSAMIHVECEGKKIMFTGDLGNSPAPFLPDTDIVKDIDYLMIESVYGDRNHEHHTDRVDLLEDIIEDTVSRGGTLVIPAFSFERTQELLFEVKKMMAGSKIPLLKVYLDSPLAIEVTKVYEKYMTYYKDELTKKGVALQDIFAFPQLHFTPTTEESKAIHLSNVPKIIIAGSGMMNGGRIVHHAKQYLPDPKSSLLLLGYQAPGTLGRSLHDGAKSVKIFGEDVEVRAKIASIGGYSAHKDSEHLLDFVRDTDDTLKKVFVVLGEPKSSLFLVQRIRDYLGIDAVMPRAGETREI